MRHFLLVTGLLAVTAPWSPASTLSPYNVLTFGNLTDTADFGGGIAAGGSITIANTMVAGNLMGESLSQFPQQYTLVAGGSLNATNGTLVNGNAYGGGPVNNYTLTTMNGAFRQAPVADPIDFAAAQMQFEALSLMLASMPANASCTFNGYSTTTCSASAPGMNVINVSDPTMVGVNRTLNINVAAGSSVVINVPGGTAAKPDYLTNWGMYVNGSGAGGNGTTAAVQNVLFNFYQATALDLYSVMGSVLAPDAAVTAMQGGQMDGALIAQSLKGQTEFYNFGFNAALPASIPEPLSMGLTGAGLLVLGCVGRRRARA